MILSTKNSSYGSYSTSLHMDQLESREVLTSFLGVASSYNAVIFNDFHSSYSDTEGRLAVGNNAMLTGYSVGVKLGTDAGTSLVVGNHLCFTNGQVDKGDAVYGNSVNTDSFGIPNGKVRQGYEFDFAAAKTELTNKSAYLAAQPATGTVTNYYGSLTFSGSSNGLNYFTIDAATLSKANHVQITVPQGGTVVINVTGSSVNLSNFAINGLEANKILWNFASATRINMSGIGIQGSILAPYATVEFNNGQINGTIVANRFCGNGQLNWAENEVCPCSCLSGSVYSSSSAGLLGIEGVTVTLTGVDAKGNKLSLTTKTDASGYYYFDSISAGSYCLTANGVSGYVKVESYVGTIGGTSEGSYISGLNFTPGTKGNGYVFTYSF